MNCPACGTATQPGARFCGVCGHRVESAALGQPGAAVRPGPDAAGQTPPAGAVRTLAPAVGKAPAPAAFTAPVAPAAPRSNPPGAPPVGKGKPLGGAVARPGPIVLSSSLEGDDDPYLGAVLNNRFRVESKLGDSGG